MKFNEFEREIINNDELPKIEDLEIYSRYSEVQPLLACLEYSTFQEQYRYMQHPSRHVRQTIARVTKDSSILNTLSHDNNYFVRAEALRNNYCNVDDSYVDYDMQNEVVLAAIASNKNINFVVKEKLLSRAKILNSFIIRYCLIRYQEYNRQFIKKCKENFDNYKLTLAEVMNKDCPS